MPRKSGLVTTPERSRLMASVRQSGTAAELSVQRIVHSCGFDYFTKANDLPGTPDLVNREDSWAIFVNGCFWHAHNGCPRWKVPKNNRAFWIKKFSDNRRRDKKKIEDLKALGYSVLILWECELENEERLKERLRRFLMGHKSDSCNNHKTRDKLSENQKIAGCIEEFSYSQSGKSVLRIIHLPDAEKVSTRSRLVTKDLNGEDAQSAFDHAFLRKRTAPAQSQYSSIVTAVDLFCGCGGLSLGAREACRALGKKFLPITAIDNDLSCLKVYERNFRCSNLEHRDIAHVIDGSIGSEPTHSECLFLKKVAGADVLLAGPPCQGYSDLNNYTRRKDSRNSLYERVARFVEIAKPSHVVIENVPTVIHGRERSVQKSIAIMREMGYSVDSGIIDLATIGIPQKRKRHIVIASTLKTVSIRDLIEKYCVKAIHTVKWAIGDLEHEVPNGIFLTPSKHTEENMERIKYLHNNEVYDLPDRLRPRCHRNGDHSYKSMYGRLRWSDPAQTITSGFGSPGQGRFVHPTQMRTLTPHEAARLQFFPDFFDFSHVEKRTSLGEMIGNAAPMKLSYIFCLELFA